MGRTNQQIIAGLMDRLDPMMEMSGMSGMPGMMGSDDSSTLSDGESTMVMTEPSCDTNSCEEEEPFSEFQLKVAKRFIELMGGADRARSVVDKVDECEDCLGLVDDDDDIRDGHDSSVIQKISGMLPGSPDLPMELSNLYNPSAGGPTM